MEVIEKLRCIACGWIGTRDELNCSRWGTLVMVCPECEMERFKEVPDNDV